MTAATGTGIDTLVNRPLGREPRRFPVPVAAAVSLVVALALAVIAALIFVAVSRGLAPGPSGQRTGLPVVVPHPAPGPFGN